MKVYGYIRSVTCKNDDEKSLQSQRILIEQFHPVIMFEEQNNVQRSNFETLEKLVDVVTKGDTIIITTLDRVAYSILQAKEFVDSMLKKGVSVNILNLGVFDPTDSSRTMWNMLQAFAQFERAVIIERTQIGKEIAKMDPNFKEGRPKKYSQQQVEDALKLLENHTYNQVEELTGISKSTLIRARKRTKS